MKKKNLILSIASLLILSSCGEESISSLISSSEEISSSSLESSSLISSSEEIESSSEASTSSACLHAAKQWNEPVTPGCDEGGHLGFYFCPECECYFDESMAEVDYVDMLLDPAHKLAHHEAIVGREETIGEYYECDVCHRYFNDDEASLEYEEGEWITSGTAHHWENGVTIATKPVNSLFLADLVDKAFKFDFKFLEDGYNFINFGQYMDKTWTISGTFTLTRSEGVYSTTKGVLSAPDEDGWVTCTINYSEFTGTGPAHHGADGLDVVFGGWISSNGGYTDISHAEFLIDPDSVAVCDPHA